MRPRSPPRDRPSWPECRGRRRPRSPRGRAAAPRRPPAAPRIRHRFRTGASIGHSRSTPARPCAWPARRRRPCRSRRRRRCAGMTRGNAILRVRPSRAFTSDGLTPEVASRTRTSPGPGRGVSISPTCSTSRAGPFLLVDRLRASLPPPSSMLIFDDGTGAGNTSRSPRGEGEPLVTRAFAAAGPFFPMPVPSDSARPGRCGRLQGASQRRCRRGDGGMGSRRVNSGARDNGKPGRAGLSVWEKRSRGSRRRRPPGMARAVVDPA